MTPKTSTPKATETQRFYAALSKGEIGCEAGVGPSVTSVGVSYENALAKMINGLYKTEVIWRRGP